MVKTKKYYIETHEGNHGEVSKSQLAQMFMHMNVDPEEYIDAMSEDRKPVVIPNGSIIWMEE